MKKLEKNQMKSFPGGYSKVCSAGIFKTGCVETNGNTVCIGYYTWGGDTISLDCHTR
jgi:hypothetical protein